MPMNPEFGYRLISDELGQAGARTCERRVWRLCSQQRLWSTTTRQGRKSRGKTPGPAVHDHLVQRVFSAPAPDLVGLTDITEHPTSEGKLYCCSVKDCFSNRVVGYSIADRMTADLAVSALRSAIARRQPNGTVVVHSDRVWSVPSGQVSSSETFDSGWSRARRRRRSKLACSSSRASPSRRR